MSQQPYDPNAFLLGSGGRSAKFDHIGASITGTISEPPQVRQQTKMEDGTPLTWENGDPKLQLVVTMTTTLREDPDDDGIRKLYVKGSKDPQSKSLHAAVAEAVAKSGAKGLEIGGQLTVTHTGTHAPQTRGYNAVKEYAATYQRPDTSQATGDFLGTNQQVNAQTGAPAPQAQQPAQPPAAPAAGDGPTPAQVAALRAAGIDDDGIRKVYPAYQPA